MELYSEEYFNFLSNSYTANETLQSSYLRLFFMLGVNEHIFNLAVRIHNDYKNHIATSKLLFIKSYVFSEVLPFENFGIDTIKVYPVLFRNLPSSCGRRKNMITIQMNEFSLLTLIHELNHIFDHPTVFPINTDKKFIYFHHRMKEKKYKVFTDSLYLTSNSEIKSRTVEFFAYLLVHHYILNKWEAELSTRYLRHLFMDSEFYYDATSLKNAAIETIFNNDDEMSDLISEFSYYKKQYNYRNHIVKEKKIFLWLRFHIFNKFINKKRKTIPKKEIEDFKIKYNKLFQDAGRKYLRRFTNIIFNYKTIRDGKGFLLTRTDIQQALLRQENFKNATPDRIRTTVDRICAPLNIT